MKFENIRVVHIIFWSDDVIHCPAPLISHEGLRNLYHVQTQLFSGLSRGNPGVKIKNAEPFSSIFHVLCHLFISKFSVRNQSINQSFLLLGIYTLRYLKKSLSQ